MCQRSAAGHQVPLLLQAFVKTTSGQGLSRGEGREDEEYRTGRPFNGPAEQAER